MTASNMMELPKDLYVRLVAAIETPFDLSKNEIYWLLEDAKEWMPEPEIDYEQAENDMPEKME